MEQIYEQKKRKEIIVPKIDVLVVYVFTTQLSAITIQTFVLCNRDQGADIACNYSLTQADVC